MLCNNADAHNVSLSKSADFAEHVMMSRKILFITTHYPAQLSSIRARPPTQTPAHPLNSLSTPLSILPLPFSLEIGRTASCGELISPACVRYLKSPTLHFLLFFSSLPHQGRKAPLPPAKPRSCQLAPFVSQSVSESVRPSVRKGCEVGGA